MTRGTIKNRETGLEIAGNRVGVGSQYFDFRVDGTTTLNGFMVRDWDFTPEPRTFEDGVYAPSTFRPEVARILKRRGGEWRDAEGYALDDEDLPRTIETWVRLVPEVTD